VRNADEPHLLDLVGFAKQLKGHRSRQVQRITSLRGWILYGEPDGQWAGGADSHARAPLSTLSAKPSWSSLRARSHWGGRVRACSVTATLLAAAMPPITPPAWDLTVLPLFTLFSPGRERAVKHRARADSAVTAPSRSVR
jgi:hypothetical protein